MEDGEDESSSLIFIVCGVAILYIALVKSERSHPNLRHITSSANQGYILSFLDALRALFQGPALVQKGYEKHRVNLFKLATLQRWLVIVAGTQYIEELRKASEDDLAPIDAASQPDMSRYLLRHHTTPNMQQESFLTRHITQNLPFLTLDIKDELVAATTDSSVLSSASEDWKEICGRDLVVPLTARVVDRIFFGRKFARNKRYSQLSLNSMIKGLDFKRALFLAFLPTSFGNFLSWFSRSRQDEQQIQKILTAYIREEKENVSINDVNHKPRDVLFQVIHNVIVGGMTGVESTLLSLNSTAKHTLALAFGHILYDLATNSTDTGFMRQEIKDLVAREGWSKNALDKMYIADSFIKESMRMNGIFTLPTIRKAVQPFTFSDGTTIPQNTFIAVPATARHYDDTLYPSAGTFDRLRFSSSHEKGVHHHCSTSRTGSVQYNLTTSTTEYLPWGIGQHACPGRFFAAIVLKTMLAHVVLHYEVKFEDRKRPPNIIVDMNCFPDLEAKIFIKRSKGEGNGGIGRT
ncbi:hypothetical protein HYPSUDRAFT_37266 [Hypholoma sublateritium FD-334 SS-4]|uniref:Cytochrome P450 n=1 Tax=Hypholoma sublateritium (strain FD-334 SS-4) TaxID=945553 RepID=A0A0D2Q2L1_HYPSF|nr:hypothetical protein HYPSUDRAFT_37266 [Hypholoma sublateritium FD-334 SS-4]